MIIPWCFGFAGLARLIQHAERSSEAGLTAGLARLIQHAEHDTPTLCRSDTRFYDADRTHMMSKTVSHMHRTVSQSHALFFEQ
jgi:hypothetical protein